MKFKQKTIGDLIESESQMILNGHDRYGKYFENAVEFNNLLQEFVKSIDKTSFIFAMFLSQVRKHLTLSLFSAVRLHHIQAMMDMRQVLEAGSCAAYAIANPDPNGFVDVDNNGIINTSSKLVSGRYKWLEKNFKQGSDSIKNMKDGINNSVAHSNIVYAHNNFKLNISNNKYITPFFDIEDDYLVKTDLWQIGNVAMGLMDLFYGVNKKIGVIKFEDDFIVRLKHLETQNNTLKLEMMANSRYQNSLKNKN